VYCVCLNVTEESDLMNKSFQLIFVSLSLSLFKERKHFCLKAVEKCELLVLVIRHLANIANFGAI
jgi:hypothetical protein